MDNITNIARTFAFLFGFWFGYGLPVILSSFSVLWPWERGGGRKKREGERQSKGNLPGDCFNIPLRASTCNDDDDDAASGPGGRHQVRGTQYQLPTTAGVLLVYPVCPFRPEYIFLFCHLSCRALFIAGSYLLPPTWLSMTLMWTCRLRLGNIALPWQQTGAPFPLTLPLKIPALRLPAAILNHSLAFAILSCNFFFGLRASPWQRQHKPSPDLTVSSWAACDGPWWGSSWASLWQVLKFMLQVVAQLRTWK